ncbi:MAG: GTPase domain-containing protein [Candidatus Obscuribacterales bacterium]|nr:MAG: gliding-motility protein MglA [Candidatus Melainabacteria bacterium]
MPLLNHSKREINCKVVYYGPGLSGKTSNLLWIHSQIAPDKRSEMVSMATQTDRTLFFDMLPLDLGDVNGWKLRLSLYTVPGQVEYNASRKLILNGADAIVFVADSGIERGPDNIESLRNMESNLSSLNLTLEDIPLILQFNKRDLAHTLSLEQLERDLNERQVPTFESVANQGVGVFQTLREASKLVLANISKLVP